jgi:hypothetical protein
MKVFLVELCAPRSVVSERGGEIGLFVALLDGTVEDDVAMTDNLGFECENNYEGWKGQF